MSDIIKSEIEKFISKGKDSYESPYDEEMAAIYECIYSEMDEWYPRQEEVVNKHGNGSILEIACGSGVLLSVLEDFKSLSGLDGSEYMINLARKRLDKDVNLVIEDFNNFKFDEKFDTIVMLGNPINHYRRHDLDGLFNSINKNLKTNGTLIYDIIPHYAWSGDRPVSIGEYNFEQYNIIRSMHSIKEKTYPDGVHENKLYMSVKVKNTETNEMNTATNTSKMYSHMVGNHQWELRKMGFNIIENRGYGNDRASKHLFVAQK